MVTCVSRQVKTARESPPSAKARRLSSDERKEMLLEVAVELCMREGIDSVTARRVASECHVSTPLVLHYFDSADEFVARTFFSVTQLQQQELEETIARYSDPRESLSALIDLLFQDPARATDSLWFDAARLSRKNRPLAAAFTKQNTVWRGILHSLIALGADLDYFRCSDTNAVTQKCWALIDGLYLERLTMQTDSAELLTRIRGYFEEELGVRPGTLFRDV